MYTKFSKFMYNSVFPQLFELHDYVGWVPILGDLVKSKKRAIQNLNLKLGDKVFISSIGTGFELAYIFKKIGNNGSIVGVDISEGMLKIGRNKIKRNGWVNVTLIQKDLKDFDFVNDLGYKVDAVLSNFGYLDEKVLHNLISILKPGGTLAISGPQPLKGLRKILYPITFFPEMLFGLTWKTLNQMSVYIDIIKKELENVVINEKTFGRYFVTVSGRKSMKL